MRRRVRFFYFSDETLGVHEIRGFRMKFTAFVFGAILVALSAIVAFNELYIDVLGFGHNQITLLTNENKILKDQLRVANRKMQAIARTLDQLAERDNHLRLLVDLPKIDPDTRAAGVGGSSDDHFDFGLQTKDAGEVVQTTHSTLEKLEREVQLQRQSYEDVVKKYEYNKDLFSCVPAIKPMEGFYDANSFGMRLHPVLKIYKSHDGLDIVNDVGTPVYASGDGVVRHARTIGGYGTVIVIDHGYGYTTLYGHLSKVFVRAGQKVQRGDKIALSGRTGLVSGPNLHYEVRYQGVKTNPVDYFFDDVSPSSYQKRLSSSR